MWAHSESEPCIRPGTRRPICPGKSKMRFLSVILYSCRTMAQRDATFRAVPPSSSLTPSSESMHCLETRGFLRAMTTSPAAARDKLPTA